MANIQSIEAAWAMTMAERKPTGKVSADPDRKRRGDRLGEQLRRLYDDVTQEDVPDDFLRLLEEADRADTPRASDTDA